MIGVPVLKKPIVAFAACGGRLESKRKLYNVPKTNRVRVLVLRKGLRAPAQSVGGLIRGPGSVAKSRVSHGSIVWKSRMIRRSVKPKIAHRDSGSQRHTEGLDRAIKILIVDGVFIMPNAGGWVRHLVDNEGTAIDSRLGLDRD